MEKEKIITIDNQKYILEICGVNNKHLRRIEALSDCDISLHGDGILVKGDKVNSVEKVFEQLIKIIKNNGRVYSNLIDVIFDEITGGSTLDVSDVLHNSIEIRKAKKIYNPRGVNQGIFIQQLREKDIVFASGPAGTGKTFLAVVYALNELLEKRVKKVVLTRPIVEAGESLGFLPGDYSQKISPYLTPLFDAISQILTGEIQTKLNAKNMIEVAPLAYMRGRTFDDCIVILDEAQNTTAKQMQLFLTRLGNNSKLIVTGDITQIDLPSRIKSGMIHAMNILHNIDDIGFIEFQEKDVVRHAIVKKIIKAYNKYDERK